MKQIRLILVDDHEILRMGLCKLFEGSKTIRVVGQAGNAAEAVMQTDCLKPDVVLMDLRLPDASGVEACRRIRSAHPNTRVLLLTAFRDQSALMASTYAGASGFVLKQSAGKQLIRAVETVATGGSFVDPIMTDAITQNMQTSSVLLKRNQNIVEFPPQQRRVLALLAEGRTNREIATILSLSEKTVIGYVRIIFRKLCLTRRSQAAVYFVEDALRKESQDRSPL